MKKKLHQTDAFKFGVGILVGMLLYKIVFEALFS